LTLEVSKHTAVTSAAVKRTPVPVTNPRPWKYN
jgi:hypothetical protein